MSGTDEPILRVAAKAILVNPEGKILIMREADEETGITDFTPLHPHKGRV
jgi:hypothetical protein